MLSRSRIEASARAGVTSFGAAVALVSTVLECNPIQLDGEPSGSEAPSFDDLGDNVCGCAGEVVTCKVLSATLEAPGSLAPD